MKKTELISLINTLSTYLIPFPESNLKNFNNIGPSNDRSSKTTKSANNSNLNAGNNGLIPYSFQLYSNFCAIISPRVLRLRENQRKLPRGICTTKFHFFFLLNLYSFLLFFFFFNNPLINCSWFYFINFFNHNKLLFKSSSHKL